MFDCHIQLFDGGLRHQQIAGKKQKRHRRIRGSGKSKLTAIIQELIYGRKKAWPKIVEDTYWNIWYDDNIGQFLVTVDRS